MKEIELKNLRKRREKHFLQEDGTIIAKVYSEDIHFKKGNEYKEIDNTLVKENGYYTNTNNQYKVYFKENSIDSLMKIEEDNNFLEITLLDSNNVPIIKNENISKFSDAVKYKNILNGIDLEYKIMSTKVKENIIINNKESILKNLYFSVKTNLELVINNNVISAKKGNEIIFTLDAPYMIDANNNINKNIYYNLINENNNYKLELVLDTNWLNNAIYPVIIDPTITNQSQDNSVSDTYIYPGDTSVDRNNQDILKAGVERVDSQDVVNRTLIKFDLPTIGTGSQVINAILYLTGYITSENSYESDIVNVHRITEDWTEENAKWENMHDKYDSRVECSFDSYRSYINSSNNLVARYNGGDITSLVKKWYSGLDNNGILLKENNEVYRNEIIPAFYSKNNTMSGDNPKPVLVISYRNQNGLENYMDYNSQSFSNGKTYVNSYNGNLTAVFNLGKTIGGKFPVNLNLIYNTNDVILDNNVGLGVGYRLSLQQTIKEVTIEDIIYLEYIDQDGTIHYFKEIDGVYTDEDGLNMTIEKSDSQYILKDKNGNQMIFVKDNEIGYLSEILDLSENKITINYDSNNLITKIADANLSEINLSYDTDKITIISPDGTTILNLSNNKIINLSTITGITSFNYNENNIISSIVDETGRKMTYEYYSQTPYRVKKVSEYGIENTLGHYFNITYNFNSTTITDEKNKVLTKTFNDKGNLISVSNLMSSNDIKTAYGNKYIYGETVDLDYSINPLKNKLLSVNIPNKYVKNYLNNSSFESDSIYFTTNDTLEMSITNETSEFGLKSLKIENVEINNSISRNVVIPKGNDYTFSAYIKNTNNVKIALSYIDVNNEVVENTSDIIYSSESFERHDITINYPSDAVSDLNIKIYFLESGVTYIDGIQLEEGEVCNNYNMIENSDFSDGLSDWTLSAQDNKTFEALSTEDYFEVVSINDNGDKALKVKMNPAVSSNFLKKYYVNGKAGDTYSISFWYKNEAFPTTGLEGDTIYNDMMIYYNYLNQEEGHGLSGFTFNPNDTDWQYFIQSFTAEKDFDFLQISFYQGKNANNFYITNMCLFKDVRSVVCDYDENGNIITSKSLNNSENIFNYNKNNQLIKMVDPKGKNLKFEYDNIVTDRVINGISDLGISNQIKYDSFGNPISNKILKNNLSGSIVEGLYRVRLKGTEKYLRNVENEIKFLEDDCGHDVWQLEKEDDYYKIKHSVIENKYLTINNSRVLLDVLDNENSLFNLIENKNGSYSIKAKSTDDYFKSVEEDLEVVTLIEDDYHFEFYFETIDNDLFIENNAEYTEDGKFIKSTIDTLFNKTIYDIDSVTGLTKSIINAKNIQTSYSYNDKKQLTSISCNNKTVNYNYNTQNMLSMITQGNKNYLFSYDEFLNIKSIQLGNDIVFVTNNYENNNGNLISSVYGNNHLISYDYDGFDRISKVIKMDDTYNYKYGNDGNLIKVISNNDTVKYTYDMAKRLNEYRFNDFKANYKYDVNDNIINIKYNHNNINYNINNTFNDDDSIIKTTFDDNEINYNYDTLGRLINSNINNQFNVNYKYITNGKRTSLAIKSVENNNDLYVYKYDKLNNITHIYHNNVLENRYYYDEYNQLTKEKNYLVNEIIKYEYDNSGNILSKKIYDLNNNNFISENKYEYNNANWEDQLTKFNNEIITYDAIGNPITVGNDITLNWINGRQLSTYTDATNVVNYKYNNSGIRTNKTVNNMETKYYLAGNNIILEKTGNNVLYYMYNEIDDLVGFKYNSNTYYYIKNLQNDIIGILDSNYNIVANYEYDSWGNIIAITDNNNINVSDDATHIANINPFRYRSYYYDKETKLYYLNNRYYVPLWGRFLNEDGIIGANPDIIGYNLYAYCSNNPIMNTDPSGTGFIKNLCKKVTKAVKKVVKKVIVTPAKAIIKTAIKTCAGIASAAGLNTGAQLLSHSLKNEPQDLNYNSNSDIAKKIQSNSKVEDLIKSEIPSDYTGYIDNKKLGGVNYGFNSSEMDLALGLHNATVYVSGNIVNGSGNLKVTVYDYYDFKHEEYEGGFSDIVTTINNAANYLESVDVINNYHITVNFDYCLRCEN